MPQTNTQIDTFTRAYLGCALWSSLDNANEQGGEPLDKNYSISDIAPETLARMIEDCASFQRDNAESLTDSTLTDSRAGFCFWLNRNGHGSGFWDEFSGDTVQAKICRILSDASKVWGTFDLYIGDDSKIHGS